MNLYQYFTEDNPQAAIALIQRYKYSLRNVNSNSDLATCVDQLVQAEGYPALLDLARQHPDKELLFDLFQQEQRSSQPASFPATVKPCACGGHGAAATQPASGAGTWEQGVQNIFNNDKAILFLGVALIGVALIAA